MFENISKGDFTTSIGGEFVVRKTRNGGIPIVQTFNKMEEDFENFEPNAKFISFCFNLQQRYDISKLEEVVNALENSKQVIENLIASKRIVNLDEALAYYKQLLKEIKK